jgi:aspartate 1-decarboxylase
MRSCLRSKIHRATVTHADLHYEGSLSIDRWLMDEADIAPFEEVHVWNITRGTRLTTYAIEAPARSGVICANGAAAHLINVGNLIIIATFQFALWSPGRDATCCRACRRGKPNSGQAGGNARTWEQSHRPAIARAEQFE